MTKKLDLIKPKKPRKKRTTKKKTYTTKGESLGVGDAVEKITKATGIKKAVEVFSLITGADCGCEERKQKLNDLFRKKKLKARCITQDEYQRLTDLLVVKRNQLPSKQARGIEEMYSSIFGVRLERWCDTCPDIWKARMAELQGVVDVYKADLEA